VRNRANAYSLSSNTQGAFRVVGSSGLMSIDLGLRGAVVGLSLLIAGLALRDRAASTVARLAAALLIGAAASAIWSAPTMSRPWPWWSLFLLALASGNLVVFWLWARAVFDDDFVLRPGTAPCGRQLSGCNFLSSAGL
jgi:hypothetical protein